MQCCEKVSPRMRVCAIMLPIACVLQVVGLSTDYWTYGEMAREKIHNGLWRACRCSYFFFEYDGGTEYRCFCLPIEEPGWMRVVQALEIVGAVGLALVGFLTLLSIGLSRLPHSLRRFEIFCAFFAATLIMTGYVMYAVLVQSTRTVHYSFCLCVIASGLAVMSGVLLKVDLKRLRTLNQAQEQNSGNSGNSDRMCYYNNAGVSLYDESGGMPFNNTGPGMPGAPPPYAVTSDSGVSDLPPSYDSLKAQGFI